jgi:hypothetical protein
MVGSSQLFQLSFYKDNAKRIFMTTTPPSETQKIFSSFWSIFQQQQSVMLLNIFHGLPIFYPARISMISKDTVALSVHPYQAVCVIRDKKTYIQSELLPFALLAHPISVDIANDEVILGHFSVENHFTKRSTMRVQPKEPIPVVISIGGQQIPAALSDISIKGVGIFTFGAVVPLELALDRLQEVQLSISLPGNSQPIILNGHMTSAQHQKGTLQNRIGLQTTSFPEAEPILMNYIKTRRSEIMDELDNLYQEMRNQPDSSTRQFTF